MANSIEVKVPDIGDYDGVPVIELLVAVGDTVKKDQGLVTLESDKATMEVPSSADGVVKSISVKIGDKVAEGAVIAILEAAGDSAAASDTKAPLPPAGEVAAPRAAGGGHAGRRAPLPAFPRK
ncbi:biotin/lipoyl-containing protein, partial [Lysobacter capsici]|uniref:biotin/lipoyl-containing protein n=1 Tax=Lysobacter capsici TaxID=435897 RepID=UPI00398CEDFC